MRLAVVLYTYDRFEYAERTLRSLLANLRWRGELRVHVADDGSPEGYVDRLACVAFDNAFRELEVTRSNSERRGYGGSHNLASQTVHPWADVVLPLEDDWELLRELDLDALLPAFEDGSISCIRFGYIGWTQELRGRFAWTAGQHFLLLDPESSERHVFAGHPRFETVAFQRRVGPWPEGIDAGSTEFIVAGRPEARAGVAWPLDLVKPRGDLFAHIGTVQARSDQR